MAVISIHGKVYRQAAEEPTFSFQKPFDLLQRTLDLQSDDIHHNEDSRLKFYPTAQDEKADRRFAQQMLVQYQRVATTTGERRSIVNTASTLGRSEAKLLWIGQLLLFLLAHSALSPRLAPIMARSTASRKMKAYSVL